VAQVTNELASLFIEENLKAREQQAIGTAEFLQNQLEQTRKALEAQEAKLKDFKLKHLGEMPEQQAATLQILGQLQSQLQLQSEALNRAEQQKAYIQSMMSNTPAPAPVVELDNTDPMPTTKPVAQVPQAAKNPIAVARARLADLKARYTDDHPEVRRLKKQIELEEEKVEKAGGAVPGPMTTPAVIATNPEVPPVSDRVGRTATSSSYSNPVLQSQLAALNSEIAKHREEQQRLARQAAQYRAKLEAVPIREQQITDLVRDYEISKAHYKNLLEKQLSADTATQLEIRQKAERFTVLDPAQVSQRPSSPNREIINAGGCAAGLALGLLLALITEFLGVSITAPEQITAATGVAVLEVIPVIRTHSDRMVRRRRFVFAFASVVLVGLFGCAALLIHYGGRVF
jgi:polysaccharide chain length determinant protein (PEP-CTERM system associated)